MNSTFPNLKKAALTIPVSIAIAERLFSALKQIKTYLRSKMTTNCLSSLAILSDERKHSKEMDNDAVIDDFKIIIIKNDFIIIIMIVRHTS